MRTLLPHPLERDLDALKTRARLASFMAHELATPLSALGTSLELLAALPSHADTTQLTARCRRLVEQMSMTVADLRVLGATERPHCQLVDVGELIEELMQALVLPNSVRFVVDLRRSPDTTLHGSCHLLTYALRNLVHNAVEAMPGGGTVGIDVESGGRSVRITVWDDGPGISGDLREALFEESFTTKLHGSGLGLRLVREIVEGVHGGEISYQPNSPAGACFHLELPKYPATTACGGGSHL